MNLFDISVLIYLIFLTVSDIPNAGLYTRDQMWVVFGTMLIASYLFSMTPFSFIFELVKVTVCLYILYIDKLSKFVQKI